MQNYDLIADKLDEVVHAMLVQCSDLPLHPHQYCVFCNMAENNAAWIVSLFFKDVAQLRKAIKYAACFQIQEYMRENFQKMKGFKDLDITIFFEPGNHPEGDSETEAFIEASFEKLERLTSEVGQINPEDCSMCGHLFKDHQFAHTSSEETEIPSEGWMMCKHENCTCFRTMSFNITGK